MNKKIKLTESQLHQLIQESIHEVLLENENDEALFGGLKALGSKFGNAAKSAGQGMANYANNKINQAYGAIQRGANYVGQKANQAGQAVGQAYNNAKQTYQTGSASDDAQTAIANAIKALNNLKAADQKLQGLGQYSVIGKQSQLIDNLLNVLGGMNGRFKARTSAFTH